MKYNYLKAFVTIIFVFQLSIAQQMPIDFSDSADTFTTFGGSGFSTRPNPVDASDTVAQFFNDGSNAWQGFSINLVSPIDLGFQKTISLSFFGFDPNTHKILLKLENGINGDVEVTQNVPAGGGWTHNITFDFSNAVLSSDGFTPVNASGTYNRLVIFIDGGVTTPGTYLIDDIDDGSIPTTPTVDVVYGDLVWSDEFDTAGTNPVDATNWFHQTQLPAGGSWFNGEEQHYTNRIDNSYVSGGYLNIVAKKESYTDQGYTKQYSSARLNSKFAFTYGRIDVKAKLPIESGTWPAIWMLGKNVNEDGGYWDNEGFGTTNWPACGEIDIMEHGIFPGQDINFVQSALHTPSSYGGTVNKGGIVTSDIQNNFHVYSMNWSPNQISFLIDDVIYYTYNPTVKDANTWPFDKDQYILLNIAMGGAAGAIDNTFTQTNMLIDYVKVYQLSALSNSEYDISDLRVFPNPAHSKINISTSSALDKVELYDVYGKRILSQSKNMKTLDISNLNAGFYLLNIYSGNKKSSKKLIIN
jgi:beta-glucanase (GH16 family)